MPSQTDLIAIGEAADLLGVSVHTLRRWDSTGKLCPVRVDGTTHRRYRRADIDAILARPSKRAS